MSRIIFASVAILFFLFSPAAANDKAVKAKEIRTEIAKLAKKIAELEKQLLELEDGIPYVGPIKESGTPSKPIMSLKDGDRGHFCAHLYRAHEVGDGFIVVSNGTFLFVIKEIETKGLAKGSAFHMNGEWVVSTGDWARQRTFVVTPGKNGKIAPK